MFSEYTFFTSLGGITRVDEKADFFQHFYISKLNGHLRTFVFIPTRPRTTSPIVYAGLLFVALPSLPPPGELINTLCTLHVLQGVQHQIRQSQWV